ncbi:hypothetical protein SUGI_0974030 [Cryptomeria japonica]|uniref:uncharacterized protein LOC131073847 n=1 Tax=Cryptomeria japonica TaxID=3369 RepID=UPI002414BD79|nr:uncharacterized protein LOC131073847 [Cryptomeria japonica]GLJ46235.1 hypothetical protein SUGI_0974030 [Cryptomeria japonica]
MASTARAYWRNLVSRYRNSIPFFKSSQVKSKQYHHAVGQNRETLEKPQALRLVKPEFFPVYALFGLVLLQLSMGLINMKQVLMHCPSVYVDKKKRKTIPEVVEPDIVVKMSEDFYNKSWFRRLGQIVKKDSELAKLMPWILERDTKKKPVRVSQVSWSADMNMGKSEYDTVFIMHDSI